MKRWFSLVLTLILCLSLFACSKQPANTPTVDTPTVDTPPVDTPPVEQPNDPPAQTPVAPPEEPVPADPLPGEQVAPEVPEVIFGGYDGSFMDSSGTVVLVRVESNLPHVESLPQIHDYYQTLWEDLKAIYELNRDDAARYREECLRTGQEFTRWTAELKFEVTRNDGVTLSMMREICETLGGEPAFTYQCETFDVASQGRLLLGDLFQPEADYLSRLVDSGELDELNFALSDDNLILCIEGGYRTLPLSDLSDILLPQYITE